MTKKKSHAKLIRVDDSFFIDSAWYTVTQVDRDKDTVFLTSKDGATIMRGWSRMMEVIHNQNVMEDGVKAYICHPAVWLPIPVGHHWYGFGYAPDVLGGYAYDKNGQVVRDGSGKPIPLKEHDYDAWVEYMADPAKHYRYKGNEG